ncbi:hypothetical protein D2V08_13965 [Flagellimonas lutimaris]|uniref:Uncharacterized protein n=1 Tax=Flagellimonas lutimaris TaxID=475082 RepID=A0A3A1N709_9FLAO|nr:hypothetical protein D2V08_13965 [Allomuricauda lutimaris]
MEPSCAMHFCPGGTKKKSKRIACWRNATDHICPVWPVFIGIGWDMEKWAKDVFHGKRPQSQ